MKIKRDLFLKENMLFQQIYFMSLCVVFFLMLCSLSFFVIDSKNICFFECRVANMDRKIFSNYFNKSPISQCCASTYGLSTCSGKNWIGFHNKFT